MVSLYWMENKFSLLLQDQASRRHSLRHGWMVRGMGKQGESRVEPAHHEGTMRPGVHVAHIERSTEG